METALVFLEFYCRTECCVQLLQTAEAQPSANTSFVVRTGASSAELKAPAVAAGASPINLSDGLKFSQSAKRRISLHNLPIGVANLHFAQIELPHVRFNLRAVSDRQHDHFVRQNVFLRYGLGLFCSHCVDAVGQF